MRKSTSSSFEFLLQQARETIASGASKSKACAEIEKTRGFQSCPYSNSETVYDLAVKTKTYADLDLAKIRDEADIDFAHFTYTGGRCSCCYYPHNLPFIYWKGKTRAEKMANREAGARSEKYEYILFKNARNGSGQKKKTDTIGIRHGWWNDGGIGKVYIEWRMSEEKLGKVCDMLQKQLGDNYKVVKPANEGYCIEIEFIGNITGIEKESA